MIVLRSINPEQNRFREYGMDIQPGLFEEWCLTRWWHRIGQKAQKLEMWFDSLEAAEQARNSVLVQRSKNGYAVVTQTPPHV